MDDDKLTQEEPNDEQKFTFGGQPIFEFGTGTGTGGLPEVPPDLTPQKKPGEKGGLLRLLLLLLLLVGGACAIFYLIGPDLFAPATPVREIATQKSSKMKVPERLMPVEPSEVVKEEVVPVAKVAAVEERPLPVAAAVAEPVVAPIVEPTLAPVPTPSFALKAGSYLYKRKLAQAITQIEKMGYKATSSQSLEPHEMTRLLVGLYAKPLADKRLAEVKRLASGAFLAAEEGKYAVYAGSFLSVDVARRSADILYQQGVRVEERQVKVDLPRTALRFGEFVTRTEARKVVRKLEKLGVDKLQIVPLK